ncbi:unnamed protein product, partial [Polarella glacialis]
MERAALRKSLLCTAEPLDTMLLLRVEFPALEVDSTWSFGIKKGAVLDRVAAGIRELLSEFGTHLSDDLLAEDLEGSDQKFREFHEEASEKMAEWHLRLSEADSDKLRAERAKNDLSKMRETYYHEIQGLRQQLLVKEVQEEKGEDFEPNIVSLFNPFSFVGADTETAQLLEEQAAHLQVHFEEQMVPLRERNSDLLEKLKAKNMQVGLQSKFIGTKTEEAEAQAAEAAASEALTGLLAQAEEEIAAAAEEKAADAEDRSKEVEEPTMQADTTDVCLDDGDVCSDDDSNSQDKNDNDNSNNSEAAEKPETLQIRSRPRKGSKERAVRSFKFDSQGSKEPQLRESTECEVQTEIETTECEVQTEMDASVIEKAEEMLQKRAENSWLELMGKVGEELSEDEGNEVQMSDLPNSAALAISESPHGDLSTGQGSSTPTESSSLTLVLPDGIAEEKQLQSPAWLPSNLQSAGNASP